MSELIINKNEEKIEVCVIEKGKIVELYSHGEDNNRIIGNIYSGILF